VLHRLLALIRVSALLLALASGWRRAACRG
jgi:hypothetical protein